MSALRALTPDEAQRLFRVCLDALSQPGRIAPLDCEPIGDQYPAAVLPLLALTDLMTPVGTLDDDDALLRELSVLTGAPVSGASDARWVLATDGSVHRFRELNPGLALRPEQGAMVCLQVDALGTGPAYRLTGPGIDAATTLRVTGLPDGFVEARSELVDTPPSGVDFLLVGDQQIAAIPRTTAIALADSEVPA